MSSTRAISSILSHRGCMAGIQHEISPVATRSYLRKLVWHLIQHVTASRGVAVLQRDIGIDSNQPGGINEIKYRRRQQVIE